MSAWIQHIKAFAARNNLSYACALSNPDCKKSYHAAKNVKESVPTGNPKLGMKGIEIKRPYVAPAAVKASKKVFNDPNLMAMIEGFRPKLSDNELSGLEDIFIELRYFEDNLYQIENQVGELLTKKRAADLQSATDAITDVTEKWRSYIEDTYSLSYKWFERIESDSYDIAEAVINTDGDEPTYRKGDFDVSVPIALRAAKILNKRLEDYLNHRLPVAAKPRRPTKKEVAEAFPPLASDEPVNKNWKKTTDNSRFGNKDTFVSKKTDMFGNKWIWNEDRTESFIGIEKNKQEIYNFSGLSEPEQKYYKQIKSAVSKFVGKNNAKVDKDKAFDKWAKSK